MPSPRVSPVTLPKRVSTPTCPVPTRVTELKSRITRIKAKIPRPTSRSKPRAAPPVSMILVRVGSKIVIAISPGVILEAGEVADKCLVRRGIRDQKARDQELGPQPPLRCSLNLAPWPPHLLQYLYEQDSHSNAVTAVCGQAGCSRRRGRDRRRRYEVAGRAAS